MRAAAYRPAVLVALGAMSCVVGSASVSASATQSAFVSIRGSAHWAYPQQAAAAHRRPSTASAVVGRLRFLTGDGQAQVYLALRSRTGDGAVWILVQLPGRPNGRSGWVPASALGEMHVTHEYLRVDRERLRATLYRAGRVIWSAPVGVGSPTDPTPAGLFYVTEKLTSDRKPLLRPLRARHERLRAHAQRVAGRGRGGHPRHRRGRVWYPGRPSHGCVRLRNTDIRRLWPLIGVGTPIEIV